MVGKSIFLICAASSGFAQTKAVANDWLIVPGVRIGPITTASTGADLRRIFGAANVKDGPIYVGEGSEEPGTVIFGSDRTRSIAIRWRDPAKQQGPTRIYACRGALKDCRWHTANGISLGTDLKTLEKLNGRPFEMSGFDWDYSGTVTSWEGGKLESTGGRLWVRLSPRPQASYDSVVGDGDFHSSHPEMQSLNPVTYDLFIEFAK
jgi:hypothetical protein